MNVLEKDKNFIWHPYTQHATESLPILIVRGKGAYVYSENGEKYLDAISSWWTNLHGHSHLYIAKKISEQAKTLEHVIFAGFTHPQAVELAERLLEILPSNQKKIFYSDNGSTAVEVALKMSFQFWCNADFKSDKTKVLALKNSYHGDTFGAMSASERGIFTKPFKEFLFGVIHVEKNISNIKSKIKNQKSKIASFIFEPLIQGAGGMLMYDAEMLDEMIYLCKKNNILTIADEVMTGFGRTGKMFACDYLSEKPDIICLSKGITGGFMPLGVTSCTQAIYDTFLTSPQITPNPLSPLYLERGLRGERKNQLKTFFHGHSYTANPLACAAACANLDLMEKKETWKKIRIIEKMHREFEEEISKNKTISEVRTLGTILAMELKTNGKTSYTNEIRSKIYNYFLSKKIILRPLGNIIYLMPPYCISEEDLKRIYSEIRNFLEL